MGNKLCFLPFAFFLLPCVVPMGQSSAPGT
jgi:hypothetical protein